MTVDERLLGERLDAVADRLPELLEEVDALATLLRSGSDHDVVRINPLRFAQRHDLDEASVVDVFLHARKVGLLRMEWQYVCPGCGEIIESFQSLTSATAHYFCQTCAVNRDADLTDFVEIAFSVAKDVRESAYHDPWSLSPEDYFFSYRFTGNGFMPDGTPIRDHLGERVAVAAFLEPRETRTFELKATPGFLYFSNGPALTVTDELAVETQQVAFEYTGPRAESFEGAIAAGAVSFAFTNATDHRYALFVVNDLLEAPRVRELVDGHELTSESVELKGVQGAVRIHRLRMATPVE